MPKCKEPTSISLSLFQAHRNCLFVYLLILSLLFFCRGPKFELIASATLTLAEASDLPHTHDLQLTTNTSNYSSNNVNNNHLNNKLPLFGHFCCRLAIQPDFLKSNYYAGNLQLIVPSTGQLFDGYARLHAFKLSIWDKLETFESGNDATHIVDITRDTKIKRKPDTELLVCNMEEGTMIKYVFRTNEAIEAANLEQAIKRAIREHLQWKHVTLGTPMQLTTPGSERNYFLRSGRHGSLYDQVPILRKYLFFLFFCLRFNSIFFKKNKKY